MATNAIGTESTGYMNQAETISQAKQVSGKTIGEPKLSDKAARYYEQLKKKYSNYDFILVSKDQKEQAEANAAKYANKNRTVVLIDDEKIEQMANDEKVRKKYENILSGAQAQLDELKKSLGNNPDIKGFGMKINDNGAASFFAAVDKNMSSARAAQQKRQEKKAEEKAAEKKKAAKEQNAERIEKAREKNRANKADQVDDSENIEDTDMELEVVSAGSIDELVKKIRNMTYAWMSDHVQTEYEKGLGANIDFKG